MTAEQQHCSAGESPKLLYTTKAENCSSWMHWLNYNPHQGFQHSFPHHLNKGLLISSGNKMGKHWQKNFSLENFICPEHVFFYCFKSSLTNAVFCPTLNTHTSQDLVGKGKKIAGSGLVSTMLQQHWILHYCNSTVQCGSHPKHRAGGFFVLSIQKENKKSHNIRIKVRYEQALNA